MGPRRSIRAARRLDARARIVAGVGGGLAVGVEPGDIVVGTEVRGPEGSSIRCPSAPLIVGELRRRGLRVHCGPIVSVKRVVDGAGRRALADSGALAVDTESVWLAPPPGTAFAVIRAVSDTERAPLLSPGILTNGFAALRALRRAVPVLDQWATAVGPRWLLVASPRVFSTGGIVEALDRNVPGLEGPSGGEISNRQHGRESRLLLVVGAAKTLVALHLCEVAERERVAARLIDRIDLLDLRDLAGVTTVAIAATDSAPPGLVEDLTACLVGLGAIASRLD